jgi:hypothetical protein
MRLLTEEIPDLAAVDPDVAGGRHVGVLPDVPGELGQKRLADANYIGGRVALRVEVRAALAATDGHAGERIREGPFETRNVMIPR